MRRGKRGLGGAREDWEGQERVGRGKRGGGTRGCGDRAREDEER